MSKRFSYLLVAALAALSGLASSAWAGGSAPGVARITDHSAPAVLPVSHSHSSCVPAQPCCTAPPAGECRKDTCRDCDDDGCCLHRLFHRDRCRHGDCDDCDECDDGCGHWLCNRCGWHGACMGGMCPHCGVHCSPLGLLHGKLIGLFGHLHGLRHHKHGLCPVGVYSRAYSITPNHFDPRDGRVYAAQGYGIPVSVPLAPQVDFTYNYGWGIPASRLTPIWK